MAILPGRSFITAPNSYSAYFQNHIRLAVKDIAENINVPVIDIAEKLKSMGARESNIFHPNEGHFNEKGHRDVADIISQYMKTTAGIEGLSSSN